MMGLARLFGLGLPSWLVGTMVAVALVSALYAKGRIDAAHVAEIAALKLELDTERSNNRTLKDFIARLEKAAREDAEVKANDDAEISKLGTKLTEMLDVAADPDRECLGAGDIDRLLGHWKGQGRTGRHPRR
jgi:hypothetical protein